MLMLVISLFTIVAEKLKNQTKEEAITADVIEEFEDEHGNVFNRKTYEGIFIAKCRFKTTGINLNFLVVFEKRPF